MINKVFISTEVNRVRDTKYFPPVFLTKYLHPAQPQLTPYANSQIQQVQTKPQLIFNPAKINIYKVFKM